MSQAEKIKSLVLSCQKCPRLREYCESIALSKRKSYRNETYWGKPVSFFGDPNAEVFLLGLAPAAHGANRTGRVFTGDRSGEWLYRALYEHGFSNQPDSHTRDDSLVLQNAVVSCVVKCAPPENKPSREEINSCSLYLKDELKTFKKVKAFVVFGKIAYETLLKELKNTKEPLEILSSHDSLNFKHGLILKWNEKNIFASYHPSQQNTFTGVLTKEMFDQIFSNVNDFLRSHTS